MWRTIDFRKRDPRFADYEKYKDDARKDWAKGKPKLFRTEDFTFDKDMNIVSVLRTSDYTAAVRMRKGIDSRERKRPVSPVAKGKMHPESGKNQSFVRWLFSGTTGDGPTFTDG